MSKYLQRYVQKLWYAGSAGNWPLAEYYRNELAETANDISAAHVTKNGFEVSATAHEVLPTPIAALRGAIGQRDASAFRQKYQILVNTCNACHQTADHPFVVITLPTGEPAAWNQNFAGQ